MPTRLDDLNREMASFGLVVDRDLRWDGAVMRFRMADRPGGDKSGWFVGREVGGRHYAHFGDWRDRSRDQKWTDNGAGTPHCDEQYRALADLLRAEREREEAEARATAAGVAAEMWAQASEEAAATHPYVVKKGVRPLGLRALRPEGDNLLLVPYLDEAGNIATVQTITPEGDKKLVKNGRIKGCCHPIPGDEDTIYICEGWATGATIHELTGRKVLVACSAGNLRAVAETARQGRPDARIVIAADNDHKTPGNPGLRYAREAAEAIGAEVAVPEGAGTDFNDMATAGFPGRAAEILTGAPAMLSIAEIMRTEYQPIRWGVEGILPEGFAVLAGRPKFGKSWLMLALAYAVATGAPAWNYGATTRSAVLYLALEDSPRRIKDRMETMCYEEFPDNLFVIHEAPRLGAGFIEWLKGILAARPDIKLVIIDTLQKIRPVSTGKRNLYQAEYEDYGGLQRLAIGEGILILGVHHTRKRNTKGESSGNPMDEISGSTGIQGVADTIIVCTRDGNKGLMHVTGREVNENTYPMTFERLEMRWTLSAPEDQVVDAGPMLLADWFRGHASITAREAAEMFKINLRTAQRKLNALVDEGKLAVEQEHKKAPAIYTPTNIFS